MADIFEFISELARPGLKAHKAKRADEAELRTIGLENARIAQDQAAQSAQEARFQNIIDNPDSTQQARQLAGQALSNLPRLREITQQAQAQKQQAVEATVPAAKSELFSQLRGGADPQQTLEALGSAGREVQAFADEPVSLFDFTKPKAKTKAQQQADVFAAGTREQKIESVFPAKSAREQAFERLTPEQQTAVVQGAGKTTVNVDVDAREAAELTAPVETKVQNQIIDLDRQITEIVGLQDNFEDDFLTVPGRARAATSALAEKFLRIPPSTTEATLEKLGIVDKADKEFLTRRTEFLLPAFTILNLRIKEITGAAVRDGEEFRLGQSTVDPTEDGPTQFRAKSKTVEDILRRRRKEQMILLKRGLKYNEENVNKIPIGSVDTIFKKEILGDQVSVQDDLKSQVDTIKVANEQGNATIANTPDANTAPVELTDKIKLDRITKAVRASDGINVNEFMKTHPQSMLAISELLDNELAEEGDIAGMLKAIRDRGMSDEDFVNAVKGKR